MSPSLCAFSEIGLVGRRYVGVLIGVVLRLIIMPDIFGADTFLPRGARRAHIGLGRRPRHGEGAFVLYAEFELQAFAPVGAIDIIPDARPLFFVLLLRLPRGVIVNEPVALDHV